MTSVYWRIRLNTYSILNRWPRRFLNASIIKVHPEVANSSKPVVALESTIFAHGMPYPHNLQLARDIISIIRSKGAIPAIIAIKNGICRVGLTEDELVDLTRAGIQGRAQKCSTREIPLLLAKTLEHHHDKPIWGATTVASTMRLAHLAGIQTFVTGGTGGVHRDGHNTMDISADLQELTKTPVIVVSAGIKSILDIPRTLEVLETLGVPTVTYQSDEFPAFFSPSSGVATPARVDSAQEIARAFRASLDLGLNCGMLVAVPNNDPAGEQIEDAIQEAIADADQLGIHGRDVTPYILQSVASKTHGDSLKSNIALVKRNASIGVDIALALFHQTHQQHDTGKIHDNKYNKKVVVMGGSVVDIIAQPDKNSTLILGSSTPGICHESDGGVGRNIAEVLGRLGVQPVLYSAVGEDARGRALLDSLRHCGVCFESDNSVAVINGSSTSTFLAVLEAHGDLHVAIADMEVLRHIPVPSENVLSQARFLVIDANPPIERMIEAAKRAVRLGVSVFFEPTSKPKARKASRSNDFVSCLTFSSPNADELMAMAAADEFVSEGKAYNLHSLRDAAIKVLSRMMPTAYLIVTLGENGVLFANKNSDHVEFYHYPAEAVHVKNTTGGGDTLAGAYLKALLDGKSHREAIAYGQKEAVLSIGYDKAAISPRIGNSELR